MGTCWPFKLMVMVGFLAVSIISFQSANADPQTTLVNKGCSQYNASNTGNFFSNLNATLADLRNQLSNKHFATAQQARSSDPVYAMVQCRDYLSTADCVSCYNTAVSQIRNCSAANGARVIYDGCFLRYESTTFYDQTTVQGNSQICSNQTAPQPANFQTEAETLLQELKLATPRINGFFAATKRQLSNGGDTVYALAQCAETVSPSGCQDCLTVADGNIQGCLPNTDGRAFDAGCFMRYSATPFFADNQTTNINPYLGGGGSNKKKAIIGGVVGGVGLLLIIFALLLGYLLYRKPKKAQRGDILGATELQGPVTYSYKVLKSATNDFSEENKLGEGGFGEVYKGTLRNGSVVAVKKLNIRSGRAKAEFESEVRLISNVHHRNLVRLLGCANKGAELLLVYEYMANGSLDRFLYGEKRGFLSWKQRSNIILGTARGLAYLHEQYHVCIIHRDIKSSNILLDDDFLPKIADFGLAKLLPDDQSHLSTRFAGTLGYTAPEYAVHGHLSEKVDTYSFGIVALEVISGRRSNDMTVEPISEYLLEKAWKLYETDSHIQLVDETMDPNDYNVAEVKKFIEVALICTQSQPSERPTMTEVLIMLSSDQSIEQRRPSNSTISSDRRFFRDTLTSLTDTTSSNSNATASFTEFTGR
ncbi:OLC1v1010284C1 [Oldenlandia corymbosa var. corymbosa]|uniref:OLC1v1010284C1 n=1 Tax=Oldenlandia corymbosa var. corymbosa TaxID=529605 RepID=A0AAV1DR09_OLDCO|nr:OLC1v1010284C1 [Oldenlandia corymbosa var. corymbosa]